VSTTKTPSTTSRGRGAEDRACDELVRRGYVIVERNYRCKVGELDVVARDGAVLVFVEVRSRGSGRYGSALETVGAVKQRRIARVAQHYLAVRRPVFESCRFDVVGITGQELTLIKDAFRL
jgi:putative endonuclease